MPQRDWDVNAAAFRALPVLEKIQKESGKPHGGYHSAGWCGWC